MLICIDFKRNNMNSPLVSVIVPTKNSSKTLGKCLESIKKQTYQNIEIVVVDNDSTDGTRDIAKKYTDRVFVHGPERAAQSNFGISHSVGKYIYKIDSDFIVEEGAVKEMVEKCEEEGLDGIAIHNTSAPGLGFWSEVRKLERDTYKDDTLAIGVRFFKKSAWEKVGKYDETIVWDDYDLHNKFVNHGFTWGRIQSQEFHLGEPKSLWEIAKKGFFYGAEYTPYLKKHPYRALQQINPIRKSYFKHWKNFIKNPMTTLGFIIMMLVKFSAGLVGFIKSVFLPS